MDGDYRNEIKIKSDPKVFFISLAIGAFYLLSLIFMTIKCKRVLLIVEGGSGADNTLMVLIINTLTNVTMVKLPSHQSVRSLGNWLI